MRTEDLGTQNVRDGIRINYSKKGQEVFQVVISEEDVFMGGMYNTE